MEPLHTFDYNGMVLEIGGLGPEPSRFTRAAHVRAPGAGSFRIEELALASEDEALVLTARVAGKNLAYLYTELLLADPGAARFYGPIIREHVRAPREKQTRGLIRPDWDDPVEVSARFVPRLFTITNGIEAAFCCSTPEAYGSSDHRLAGLYQRGGGQGPLRALLTFDGDGELKRIVAYARQAGRTGPRLLTPEAGDCFTPFVQVFTPPEEGSEWGVANVLSTPVGFGGRMPGAIAGPPLPGEYLAGLVAQDLDGGFTRECVRLTIGE